MFSPLEIQARVRKTPFVPFEIVTSAGEVHPIRHPELIMVGLRFVSIGIESTQYPLVFDLMTQVAVIHITELRDLPVPVPAGSNGTT